MWICCSESWKKPAYFFGKMNRVPALHAVWFSLLSSIFWPENPPLRWFSQRNLPEIGISPHFFTFSYGFFPYFRRDFPAIAMFSENESRFAKRGVGGILPSSLPLRQAALQYHRSKPDLHVAQTWWFRHVLGNQSGNIWLQDHLMVINGLKKSYVKKPECNPLNV
jgi:hypothetical protein